MTYEFQYSQDGKKVHENCLDIQVRLLDCLQEQGHGRENGNGNGNDHGHHTHGSGKFERAVEASFQSGTFPKLALNRRGTCLLHRPQAKTKALRATRTRVRQV